jgi:hypothetical protein
MRIRRAGGGKAAAVLLALLLAAACGSEGPPSTPAGMLARVPADATFVASADLSALLEDPLSREVGLADVCESAVREMLDSLEGSPGIDTAEDLHHLLLSGDAEADPPWILGELWGRFVVEDLAAFLRGQGLVEGERDGRPAFTWEGQQPPLVIVLEGPRRVRFGTAAGLGRSPEEGDATLGADLRSDPLVGILDRRVDAFVLYLDPRIDPALIEDLPMLGGMLGRIASGFEGMSAALWLGDGITVAGRTTARREADAQTVAALIRGGLDFARVQLRAIGERDAADAVDAIAVKQDGVVLTVEARIGSDLVRRLARMIAGEFHGPAAGGSSR